MYISSQGIVHGTYSTLLNGARLKFDMPEEGHLDGRLFVSSGLGGMSGAQGKAIEIAGGVGIIAEVDASRIRTRHDQGWVSRVVADPAEAFQLARSCQAAKTPTAIAFEGNVVDLLEYAVQHQETIDLLSDQTSCHVPYDGGYTPAGVSFEEGRELLRSDLGRFRDLVE